MRTINMSPRKVVKWKGGQRREMTATPEQFSSERAEEVYEQCRQQGMPWVDQLSALLTPEEHAFVDALWETMGGSSNFAGAFLYIKNTLDAEIANDLVIFE